MALLNKEDADIISAKYILDSDENNSLYIRTSDVCENGERDILMVQRNENCTRTTLVGECFTVYFQIWAIVRNKEVISVIVQSPPTRTQKKNNSFWGDLGRKGARWY